MLKFLFLNFNLKLRKSLFLIITGIFTFLLIFNSFTFVFFRKKFKDNGFFLVESDGYLFYPYNNNQQFKWFKANFHIHTEDFFHIERHNSEIIKKIYLKNGFDIISFSKYNELYTINEENYIPTYEWGMNLKKKHFLVINAKYTFPDFFPFFQNIENLNWSLFNINSKDQFIVLNHPKLLNAYNAEEIIQLKGIQAMEIFTPFGDSIDLWDNVLSLNKPILGFASDDLHYFPDSILEQEQSKEEPYKTFLRKIFYFKSKIEGEALQRYIMIFSKSKEKKDIIESLCSGSYVLIKEWGRNSMQKFEIKKIESNPKFFEIEFFHPVYKIYFKTKFGKVIKEFTNTIQGKLYFNFNKEKTPYIRIEVWDVRGILLSNPVMQFNQKIYSFCN